jgi:hypothetical protein
MANPKYSKNIVTLKPDSARSAAQPTRLIRSPNDVIPDNFRSENVWLWPDCASEKDLIGVHTHTYDEVIGFFGTNRENPHDLHGEVELMLEDEKHVLTESFLAFIPAGMKCGPIRVPRIDRTIFHYTLGRPYDGKPFKKETVETDGSKYGKYIVTGLKQNIIEAPWNPDMPPDRTARMMFLDNDTIDGAFYMEVAWFWPTKEGTPGPSTHSHDYDEVLYFFGTDPDNLHKLNAEVELWIDGKRNLIKESFVAFIPAGTVHCPIRVPRVDIPMFHFASGFGVMYF